MPRLLHKDNWDSYSDRLTGFEVVRKCYSVLVIREVTPIARSALRRLIRPIIEDAWSTRLHSVKFRDESNIQTVTIVVHCLNRDEVIWERSRLGIWERTSRHALPK